MVLICRIIQLSWEIRSNFDGVVAERSHVAWAQPGHRAKSRRLGCARRPDFARRPDNHISKVDHNNLTMQNKSAFSAFFSTSMVFWSWACHGNTPSTDSLRYLALGDSYTIGTSVKPEERFPMQLVKTLKQRGVAIQKPKYVARVGWSTDQLTAAMDRENLESNTWDFVTLLIGVNNQYRGGALEQYKVEFVALLKRAIKLAGNDKKKVIVLSIPDYGFTPFGQRYQATRISREIDAFNVANRKISEEFGVAYLDITPISREALKEKSLIADDGLHPSGKMYQRWTEQLLKIFPVK